MRYNSARRSPYFNRNLAVLKIKDRFIAAVLLLLLAIFVHIAHAGRIDHAAINPSMRKRSFRHRSIYKNEQRTLQENENLFGIENEGQFQAFPIRIQYDTRMIQYKFNITNDATIKNDITYIVDTILPKAAQIWGNHLYIRRPNGDANVSTDEESGSEEMNHEITIDATDCELDVDLETEIVHILFPNATTYTNVDIVLIIGGDLRNQCNTRQLAYARACALDIISDRPIIGIIDFCFGGTKPNLQPTIYDIPLVPYYQNFTGVPFQSDHLQISMLDVALHEMTHVFGMSSNLFPYFRDENGVPRMERDNVTGWPILISRTCGDGTLLTNEFEDLPSDDIVAVVSMEDGTYQQFMITPTVQAVARNHFNCSIILGARLDDSSSACISSHWHERHYYNDLMGLKASKSSVNSLSLLTLALLADTGWYNVDFRNVTQLDSELPKAIFGINAGCDFISQRCIDNRTDHIADWVVNEFCDDPYLLLQPVNETSLPELLNHNIYCDPSHRQWTLCDLVQYTDGTIPEISYFTAQNLGPLNFTEADHCPIPDVGLGFDCGLDTPSYETFYPGESVGLYSRCINAFYYGANSTGVDTKIARPACMAITCDKESGVVRIGTGSTIQICTTDGQKILLPDRSDNASISCPRLAVVCPEMYTCPDGCFGQGICVYQPAQNGVHIPPHCRCFNETNTDPSCAPPMFVSTNIFQHKQNDTKSPPTKSPTMVEVATSKPVPVPVPLASSNPIPTSTSNCGNRIPDRMDEFLQFSLILQLLYSVTAFVHLM